MIARSLTSVDAESIKQALFGKRNAVLPLEKVAAAVHDLKNPICSILNVTSALLQKSSSSEIGDDELRSGLELIRRLAHQMSGLTNDMLPSAKSRGPRRASRQPGRELIEEAALLMRPSAHGRGISLQTGPVPRDCVVKCERQQILRVFSNLIGNAIQYSPAGTQVTLWAEQGEDCWTFKVRDEGRGIPPGMKELIFEKYWQCEPGKSNGLGLGLSISQEIVSSQGGRIWAQNPVRGAGSIFCFTLPAARAGSR